MCIADSLVKSMSYITHLENGNAPQETFVKVVTKNHSYKNYQFLILNKAIN